MSRGVVFQGGGTGLKIGSVEQDAASADVFDLLFNSDIQPLRLMGTGYVAVPSLRAYNWSPVWAEKSSALITTPSGTYPLFIVAGKQSGYGGTGYLQTPIHTGSLGFGAVITSNRELWGLNFSRDIGEPWQVDAIVNYCILKNYG